MKYISVLVLLSAGIVLLSFKSQDKELSNFIVRLKYDLLHKPNIVSESIHYPFSFMGKLYSQSEHKKIENFILDKYIKKNLVSISLNDITEYDNKMEHPFYGYDTYSSCFKNIPLNQKIYEINVENEQGHGPAYFILISSIGKKFYIFSIAN